MATSRALSRRSRAFAAMLVLLALALRFAIPAGYMLAGDGSLALVPCPSSTPRLALTHGSATGGHSEHAGRPSGRAGHHTAGDERAPGATGGNYCPFSALAAPALPPAPQQLALHDLPDRAASPEPALRAPVTSMLAAPPPLPRGPPVAS